MKSRTPHFAEKIGIDTSGSGGKPRPKERPATTKFAVNSGILRHFRINSSVFLPNYPHDQHINLDSPAFVVKNTHELIVLPGSGGFYRPHALGRGGEEFPPYPGDEFNVTEGVQWPPFRHQEISWAEGNPWERLGDLRRRFGISPRLLRTHGE